MQLSNASGPAVLAAFQAASMSNHVLLTALISFLACVHLRPTQGVKPRLHVFGNSSLSSVSLPDPCSELIDLNEIFGFGKAHDILWQRKGTCVEHRHKRCIS